MPKRTVAKCKRCERSGHYLQTRRKDVGPLLLFPSTCKYIHVLSSIFDCCVPQHLKWHCGPMRILKKRPVTCPGTMFLTLRTWKVPQIDKAFNQMRWLKCLFLHVTHDHVQESQDVHVMRV